MDPGKQPECLKYLSEFERLLIVQVNTVLEVIHLKSGQNGYSGQVINFNQDLVTFTSILPPKMTSIKSEILIKRSLIII